MERTQLPKTTVFRLLRTLIHGGLLERASSGVYRNRFGTLTARPFRIGFAAQGDSEFCRAVMQNMETAAAREHVHLITVNNRYSAAKLSATPTSSSRSASTSFSNTRPTSA